MGPRREDPRREKGKELSSGLEGRTMKSDWLAFFFLF
jgi:hypothetical protein